MISVEYIRQEGRRVRGLCAGHYDIRKYAAVLEEEYSGAYRVETEGMRGLPHKISPSDACKLASKLAALLHVKRLKQIILNSAVAYGCAGAYENGAIHFPDEAIFTATFLHEFGHHVCYVERWRIGHGKEYCEALELVFQAAHVVYNNKLS